MRAHFHDIADRARLDQCPHTLVLRMEAVHEAFHEWHIAPLESFNDLVRIVVVQRKRLLAQYRLARLGSSDCPFQMHRIWQRDIDRIDPRIGQQRLVA